LYAYSLLLGSFDASFLLKENILTWSVDLRCQGHVYVLSLFTRDLQLLSSLLEEKVLILKDFLIERRFDLRESLDGRLVVLGGDLGGRLGGRRRRP